MSGPVCVLHVKAICVGETAMVDGVPSQKGQ